MRFLLQYCKIKALTDENSHCLYTLIYIRAREFLLVWKRSCFRRKVSVLDITKNPASFSEAGLRCFIQIVLV